MRAGRLAITLRLGWACCASEIPSLRWPVLRVGGSWVQPRALNRSALGGSLGPFARCASVPSLGGAPRCPQPRPAPPGPAGLRRPGPRSRRGSGLASHPAPPSLRRAGAPSPASPTPSHLRPPPSSPRVAIFSKSSVRRHRFSSQLTVRSRSLPPSRAPTSARPEHPAELSDLGPRSRRARRRLLLRSLSQLLSPRWRSSGGPRVNFQSPLGFCLAILISSKDGCLEKGEKLGGSPARGEGGRDSLGRSGRR